MLAYKSMKKIAKRKRTTTHPGFQLTSVAARNIGLYEKFIPNIEFNYIPHIVFVCYCSLTLSHSYSADQKEKNEQM